MRKLVLSQRFKKNLRDFLRKHPDLKHSFQERIALLQNNPTTPALKMHPLSGKLKGCFALSINYKYRLIFSSDSDTIYLLAIGSHDHVY